MKRIYKTVVAAIATCALALVLGGCEQLGITNTGNGIPRVGEAVINSPVISQDGVLRVGVNAANAPFSTMVDNNIFGIDVDIAAALANELGLKVEIVDVGAAPEDALANNTVDVVMGMDSADTSATCWLSEPYLATAVAIFATSSGAIMPTAESNSIIEAQESSMSAWEITNQFGENSLQAVPDLKRVFEDLEAGQTTYGAADAVIGSYVTRTSNGKAMIIGLMQKPSGYCVGVSSTNTALRDAVSNAVRSLVSKGVVGVIESKWIGQALDLNSAALTEAAQKGSATAEAKEDEKNKEEEAKEEDQDKDESEEESSVGEVGGNAVELEDDGSEAGEGEQVVADDGWNYYYYDQTATDQTYYDQTTTDQTQTYYDQTTTDQTYVDQTATDQTQTYYDQTATTDVQTPVEQPVADTGGSDSSEVVDYTGGDFGDVDAQTSAAF